MVYNVGCEIHLMMMRRMVVGRRAAVLFRSDYAHPAGTARFAFGVVRPRVVFMFAVKKAALETVRCGIDRIPYQYTWVGALTELAPKMNRIDEAGGWS